MRRLAYMSASLLLAACASGGRTAVSAPIEPSRDVQVGSDAAGSYTLTVRREANVATAALPASAALLWPALVTTFDTLGIAVSSSDANARLLTSSTGKRVVSIAGQRISRFFECPATGYGNSAQGQDTYLTLQAQLLPAGEASTSLRMQTQSFVLINGARVECRSTGRLEQLIGEHVARKAGLLQ
jgi:hypothetical protein